MVGRAVRAAVFSALLAAGTAAGAVTVTVPVVLDVYGRVPTHYTSDLVLVNRGARRDARHADVPAVAGDARRGDAPVNGHRRRRARAPDPRRDPVPARPRGATCPRAGRRSSARSGVTFLDVADPSLVFAGSRTSTPNPDAAVGGSFGLFAPAIPVRGAAAGAAHDLRPARGRGVPLQSRARRPAGRKRSGVRLDPALRRRHGQCRGRADRVRARARRLPPVQLGSRPARREERLGDRHAHGRRHATRSTSTAS